MPRSKQTELLERLKSSSIPLLWRDFKRLFENHLGFKVYSKSGGSARAFIKGEVTFTAHEPHGREKTVSKETRRNALRAIAELEAIEAENLQAKGDKADEN